MARPAHDESRLPKWAQDELRRLRMRLDEAHRALAKQSDLAHATALADPYDDHPQPLRKDHVEFKFPSPFRNGHNHINVRRIKDREGERLHIMGGDSLDIRPMAANVIEVRPQRWEVD